MTVKRQDLCCFTWVWILPVTALNNKVWWKWCFASFWAQGLRKWWHLPPSPWETLSGSPLLPYAESGYSDKTMLERPYTDNPANSLSSAQPSSHPHRAPALWERQLALCRSPLRQPNATEWWPVSPDATGDLPLSPAQLTDSHIMWCNEMIGILQHLEPICVLDILLFSTR